MFLHDKSDQSFMKSSEGKISHNGEPQDYLIPATMWIHQLACTVQPSCSHWSICCRKWSRATSSFWLSWSAWRKYCMSCAQLSSGIPVSSMREKRVTSKRVWVRRAKYASIQVFWKVDGDTLRQITFHGKRLEVLHPAQTHLNSNAINFLYCEM